MPAALLLALAIANFADYPRLRYDVQAHYVSSYDRTGGNDDGFDGTYSALYVDESGEHVIFDVKGPATLLPSPTLGRAERWPAAPTPKESVPAESAPSASRVFQSGSDSQ